MAKTVTGGWEESLIWTHTTDFDRPSNFEIPGNSMAPSAPVRDALVQGFLNTMRVAVVGLILATVLGTLIGVGRLSHNAVMRTVCRVLLVQAVVFLCASVVYGADAPAPVTGTRGSFSASR